MDQTTFGMIIAAFLTGLTTGGLSCLAVQGGLLAASLAQQIETDLVQAIPSTGKGKGRPNRSVQRAANKSALPIAAFLLAKLAAYTLLGALLGLVGSYLTLSPLSRAILMIAIGIFMAGNGLRMLNVHPVFRYFNFEPPRFITRYIRRTARSEGGRSLATPLFLGALTVLIPCGVTQAMMAAALGTGNPARGAALLFAFTLGTSPVFFLLAYLTTQLGARLERYFLRFVAVVVLVLGLISLDSGLNLAGAPFTITRLVQGILPSAAESTALNSSHPNSSSSSALQQGRLELAVQNNGYFPRTLRAPANQPLQLDLVTNNTRSCARDFVIPALDYYALLPLSGRTTVAIPPQAPGAVLRFTCSMGMYTGQIVFE